MLHPKTLAAKGIGTAARVGLTAALSLCWTLALAQAVQSPPAGAAPNDLSPEVLQSIESVLPKAPPTSLLRRIRSTFEIPSLGHRWETEVLFERLDGGLVGVERTDKIFVSPKEEVGATTVARAIALQGLVDLVTSREVSLFDNSRVQHTSRVTGLAGDVAHIVRPEVGTKFSVELNKEWQGASVRTSKPIIWGAPEAKRSESSGVWKGTLVCSVDGGGAAAVLHPSLRGDYVRVNCVSSDSSLFGTATKASHAFLPDAGLYIPLSTDIKGATPPRFVEVEYAN